MDKIRSLTLVILYSAFVFFTIMVLPVKTVHGADAAQPPEVTLSRTADAQVIEVRDHGPGVPPERLARLQQRHVRHSASRAGYGLGLSIASTIAHKHGARLRLSSPPPGLAHGFEARLELPALQASSAFN